MNTKNKIKGYRNMLGKTQSEMAKELNISSQSYYNKENGYVSFKDEEKIIIKKMLIPHFPKITIEDIFFLKQVVKSYDFDIWPCAKLKV